MIPLRRPPAVDVLDHKTRAFLERRSGQARQYPASDQGIERDWKSFLKTKARSAIDVQLNRYTRGKCVYCEQTAAQDIEHYYLKSRYPDRMFDWENLLRGCKNCNQFKRDAFPLDEAGHPLLLDPCVDEPLDFFVWDLRTGTIGVATDPDRRRRAEATRDNLRLNLESYREERRAKALLIFLIARIVDDKTSTEGRREARNRLRDELDPRRPWIGSIRQLLIAPEPPYQPLIRSVIERVPEIRTWIRDWIESDLFS